MKQFACYMKDLLQYQLPVGVQLFDISGHEERYSMYKIGPILSVSVGCSFTKHYSAVKRVHFAAWHGCTLRKHPLT